MRVTKCLFLITAVLLLPAIALAGAAPTKDAVRVGTPELAAAGSNVAARRITVPIELDNVETLVAMDIPLRYGQRGDGIELTNVSYGARVEYFDEKITRIDNDDKTVIMGLISMAYDPTKEDLGPGSGPLAYLTFDVTDPSISEITIASTTMQKPSHRLMLVYHDVTPEGFLQVRWNDNLDFSVTVPVSTASAAPVPTQFALEQNYPNPFNAGTVIRFGLPKSGRVSMSVYNVLGQTVTTLIDGEEMEAGYRNVAWDGRDNNGNQAPSGVYFYRIQAGKHLETKKMTLLK